MIEIDLARRRRKFSIEVKVSLRDRGITTLFGPSGAGKSTLIWLIAGLLRPDRGRVRVAGRALFDSEASIDLPAERRRLGLVFQDALLFPHLSVRANLAYGMRRRPAGERRLALHDVVALLGIGRLLARRPHQLSGGERQRVAIGRALLSSPDLLLMDEPLASLDQPRKNDILPFIRRLPAELGMPVIYVSHAVEEVIRISDSVVALTDGRVCASGPVDEVLSRPDLAPLTGRFWSGAVIDAMVGGDDGYGLTSLAFAGGRLLVPRLDHAPGTAVRVRIRSRDVALALVPPRQSSVLNAIPAAVVGIADNADSQADVLLDAGGARLVARITERSLAELGLGAGDRVWAMIKASSVDRPSVQVVDDSRPAAPGAVRG